jgi:hypothetical protein
VVRTASRTRDGKFAVITIAIDITTIVIAVISSIVSVVTSGLITWYFSRRHYTRVSRPVTETDIKLQSGKHDFYLTVLFIVLFIGGGLARIHRRRALGQ